MNKTEICNIALARIGVSRFIDSLDERSTEAVVCKKMFDIAAKATFRKDYFPSLKTYRTLALVAEYPNKKWGFAYKYPSDCVRFRCIGQYRQDFSIPFERGIHNGEDVIFTDQAEADAEYQVLPDEYDDAMGSMLAWRLGAEIVVPLGVDMGLRNDCLQMFQVEKSEVMATELNEAVHEVPDSEFISVRGLD